ncbi:septation protein SepH [Ruania alba]|uniref:DUF3071 domain-containing protein n=1 Tax=Ruania alba TaxID=648782 RepID=A0A1H5FJD6_9MICO|nr:septation protein SepH [Ruania alba]SEE03560.1 Protein of unknown function [Ruania alba]
MVELELVGIHTDAEHLVLMGPEGERYRLVIDDALRAAVRRDRPHLEKVRTEGAVRPREIQVMIRAGASAEDIAADSGVPLETIRRYEGPVIAERQHVSQRARALTISRESGAPVLSDVVVDRLASRGVEADSIVWDSRRTGQDPWVLVARFVAGEREREATWQVDLSARMLTALDDESRWLSETEWPVSDGPRRHLSAVRGGSPVYDIEATDDVDITGSLHAVDAALRPAEEGDGSEGEPSADATDAADDADQTEALLDQLSASRGVRQPVADPEEDDVHEPMLWDDPPPAHPPASHPEERPDATVLHAPQKPTSTEDSDDQDGSQARDTTRESGERPRRTRRRRTSVPSWDEIVFGAKND